VSIWRGFPSSGLSIVSYLKSSVDTLQKFLHIKWHVINGEFLNVSYYCYRRICRCQFLRFIDVKNKLVLVPMFNLCRRRPWRELIPNISTSTDPTWPSRGIWKLPTGGKSSIDWTNFKLELLLLALANSSCLRSSSSTSSINYSTIFGKSAFILPFAITCVK
jgi:hypothetical protein